MLTAPLLERISYQLRDRVQQEIKTDMLKGPIDLALSIGISLRQKLLRMF